METYLQSEKYRTAIHEAGHVVLLHKMDIEVKKVTIKEEEGYVERIMYDSYELELTYEEYAKHTEDFICMLYAGAVAEKIEFGEAEPHGYLSDIMKIDDILKRYIGDDKQELINRLLALTKTKLLEEWEIVKKIASELYQKEELHTEEILAMMKS